MLGRCGLIIVLLGIAGRALCGDYAYMVNSGCDFEELTLTQPDKNIVVSSKNCDNLFRKQDWQEAPLVKYAGAKDNKKYLLVMLDPDAPNHPNGVFYFHWAVANINGTHLKARKDLCHEPSTLLDYMGPSPPQGSGQHRYVFLLYEQDSLEPIEAVITEKRAMFDLGKWITPLSKKHPLTGPVAGSQFRVPSAVKTAD